MATGSRFYQILHGKIIEELETRKAFVVGGGPQNYEDYKESAGYIKGLMDTLRLLEETESEILGDR